MRFSNSIMIELRTIVQQLMELGMRCSSYNTGKVSRMLLTICIERSFYDFDVMVNWDAMSLYLKLRYDVNLFEYSYLLEPLVLDGKKYLFMDYVHRLEFIAIIKEFVNKMLRIYGVFDDD